jgi:hypothetical protein
LSIRNAFGASVTKRLAGNSWDRLKDSNAISELAKSLNHAQRGRLRCRPRPGRPREYDVPSERTFRRLLKKVDPEQLKNALVGWMQTQDKAPLRVVHMDGKVVKNPCPILSATFTASLGG